MERGVLLHFLFLIAVDRNEKTKKYTVMILKTINIIVCLTIFLAPIPGFCIEPLTSNQMKIITAQAGISIALSDIGSESFFSKVSFANPDDPDNQYLSFNDLQMMNHFTTTDAIDGTIYNITIDIETLSGMTLLSINSPNVRLATDMTVSAVDFCGTNIGALSFDNMVLSSFHFDLGAQHGRSGIDSELGFTAHISSFSYHYNSSESLVFSGINFANSFNGLPESEPSTWTSSGSFQVGNITTGAPATLNIAGDETSAWSFIDSSGTPYTVDNPRYGSGYIAVNAPLSGSIRVGNINFGGADLGPLIIDGINVMKLTVEIPGRGLGKP